jgi:4a-hydroxytetrahydrobiopterin dehydratase
MAREKLDTMTVVTRAAEFPGWSAEGDTIRKTFKFPDHITAMGFVNRVAMCAEVLDHHPDLRIVYGTVDIVLSTHDAGGVTDMDFKLAAKIEQYS